MLSLAFYANSFPSLLVRTWFTLSLVISSMYVHFAYLLCRFLDSSLAVPCYIPLTSFSHSECDCHTLIFDLHSSSLKHRHHPLPNPLPSILLQISHLAYIDCGPFRHIIHRQLSSMFLSRRVNWYASLIFLVIF
jgi:hypothetical protein